MEKIIVSMKNPDAIEVRENNRLAPRYGMSQMGFRDLTNKEEKVLEKCKEILKKKQVPVLVKKFFNLTDVEEKEFFSVLKKAKALLKNHFHVLIIRGMIDCACGRKSGLGYGCFDEKFSPAYTDLEVRKDFWGTEHLLPLELVSALLLDLMSDIDPNDFCEETAEKSEIVRYFRENDK